MGIIDFIYTTPVSYWSNKKADEITATDGVKVLAKAAVAPAVVVGAIVTAPVPAAIITAGGLVFAACNTSNPDQYAPPDAKDKASTVKIPKKQTPPAKGDPFFPSLGMEQCDTQELQKIEWPSVAREYLERYYPGSELQKQFALGNKEPLTSGVIEEFKKENGGNLEKPYEGVDPWVYQAAYCKRGLKAAMASSLYGAGTFFTKSSFALNAPDPKAVDALFKAAPAVVQPPPKALSITGTKYTPNPIPKKTDYVFELAGSNLDLINKVTVNSGKVGSNYIKPEDKGSYIVEATAPASGTAITLTITYEGSKTKDYTLNMKEEKIEVKKDEPKKPKLPKCSDAYAPAMQTAMKLAGKCVE